MEVFLIIWYTEPRASHLMGEIYLWICPNISNKKCPITLWEKRLVGPGRISYFWMSKIWMGAKGHRSGLIFRLGISPNSPRSFIRPKKTNRNVEVTPIYSIFLLYSKSMICNSNLWDLAVKRGLPVALLRNCHGEPFGFAQDKPAESMTCHTFGKFRWCVNARHWSALSVTDTSQFTYEVVHPFFYLWMNFRQQEKRIRMSP